MPLPVPRALVLAVVALLGVAMAAGAGNAGHEPRTLSEMAGTAPTPSTAAPGVEAGEEIVERARSAPEEAVTSTSDAPSTTTTEKRHRPARPRGELILPTTTTTQRPATLEETLLRAALDRIDYPWQRTGFDIALEPARSGYLGVTEPTTHTIEIYVRQGQTVDEVARTLAHEIGHAVDLAFRTPQDRIRYRAIRGLSQSGMWAGCDGCTDYATPAGDYAETFAYWMLGPGDYRSQLAGPPDAGQLGELRPLFAARSL